MRSLAPSRGFQAILSGAEEQKTATFQRLVLRLAQEMGNSESFQERQSRQSKWAHLGKFATQQRHEQLTRKPSLFFLPPCRRRERSPGAFCGRQPDIASGSKGIQALKPVCERGRRSVHGNVRVPSAPSQRVHRVPERGRCHGEQSIAMLW
jgi:hypothetical protein